MATEIHDMITSRLHYSLESVPETVFSVECGSVTVNAEVHVDTHPVFALPNAPVAYSILGPIQGLGVYF